MSEVCDDNSWWTVELLRDEHVVRLQISMNDATIMQILYSSEYLKHYNAGIVNVEPATVIHNISEQITACDELLEDKHG